MLIGVCLLINELIGVCLKYDKDICGQLALKSISCRCEPPKRIPHIKRKSSFKILFINTKEQNYQDKLTRERLLKIQLLSDSRTCVCEDQQFPTFNLFSRDRVFLAHVNFEAFQKTPGLNLTGNKAATPLGG
ncbi:hypothetical protein CDAR_452251 [Caerostris darwini]|uniref:Uncharacterized protein n=1 Tax=Caerostris darwini TaxID=1538125 RepID=A0AAV4PRZ0_9ARAC|nr:hypothetical protein CDAR_452251 [Caerostris darwini]